MPRKPHKRVTHNSKVLAGPQRIIVRGAPREEINVDLLTQAIILIADSQARSEAVQRTLADLENEIRRDADAA